MSNIGFMQHFTKNIEQLYKECIENPKKNPTSTDKEDYVNTIQHLEDMKAHGEIEDVKLYDILMRKIINNDIRKVAEDRRKLRGKR